MEKYGTAGHIIDANIIRRMRFAGRIPKATDTHSEFVIHVAFLRRVVQSLVVYAHFNDVMVTHKKMKLFIQFCRAGNIWIH